jgi:hypothetical protein
MHTTNVKFVKRFGEEVPFGDSLQQQKKSECMNWIELAPVTAKLTATL